MAEESARPPDLSPTDEYRESKADRSALERVSMLVPNLTEETTVSEVAADADVSKETARKYLDHFESWNVVVRTGTNPDAFVRNESYFDWLRVDTLQQNHSVDKLQELLSDLAAEDQRFAAELEAESPTSANVLGEGYGNAGERAERIRAWQSVRDRMTDVVAALQTELDLASDATQVDSEPERYGISE